MAKYVHFFDDYGVDFHAELINLIQGTLIVKMDHPAIDVDNAVYVVHCVWEDFQYVHHFDEVENEFGAKVESILFYLNGTPILIRKGDDFYEVYNSWEKCFLKSQTLAHTAG